MKKDSKKSKNKKKLPAISDTLMLAIPLWIVWNCVYVGLAINDWVMFWFFLVPSLAFAIVLAVGVISILQKKSPKALVWVQYSVIVSATILTVVCVVLSRFLGSTNHFQTLHRCNQTQIASSICSDARFGAVVTIVLVLVVCVAGAGAVCWTHDRNKKKTK